jgi:NAD(P)-dependent dehydrogenase (short-subunit alcohol dehydrogenase family)
MSEPAAALVGTTSLAGRTALVTGAATGIGQAIAAGLAAAGASVVINHNHTPEPAGQVVAEITATGGTAIAAAADVSSRAEYQATVRRLLEQFTHILSQEFGPRGITVNAVSPGATETETYRIGKSEQFLASLQAMSAFGRLGPPAEIAAMVTFLASDAARWITVQHSCQRRDRVTPSQRARLGPADAGTRD